MKANESGQKPKLDEVIRILSSLAHGIDPQSGEKCADDSLCNRPDIIRALFVALEHLQDLKKGMRTGSSPCRGSTRSWTAELDEELKERYLAGAALPELMRIMGRGRGALIGRLKLLGLIDDADHVRD